MKRIIKLSTLLVFFYIFFISSFIAKAMSTKRPSFVEETKIVGIVPIDDEQITVNKATFDLDFYGSHRINVDKGIEKSANLKMTYDLTYNGSNASVNFSLPLLNKLQYLDQGVQIFADGVEIKPNLYISPQYNNYYNSNERMEDQNFITEYRKKMLSDYEFNHDVVGYQYTVKAPKTKGKKFLVQTKLNFNNVPDDTVFMDIGIYTENGKNLTSYSRTLKAEEEFVFFSSSNLLIEPESIEIEEYNGIYISHDVKVENPKITKKPIKLSEYLDIHSFKNKKYIETQKMFFYYNVDNLWNDLDNYHVFNSESILKDINLKYYEMSLEFNVDFHKPQTQIEILLPIPIHCYKKDMTIVVVANPASTIQEFGDLFVNIKIDEKLVSSNESHIQESSKYKWKIDGDTTLEIVYTNSSDDKSIAFIVLLIGFISILAIVFKFFVSHIIPALLIISTILVAFKIFRLIRQKKIRK